MPLQREVLGGRGADSVHAQTCRVWPRRAQLRGGQRRGVGKPGPRAEAQLQRLRHFLTARRTRGEPVKGERERGSEGGCVWGAPAGLAGREHSLKSLHVREGNAGRRGVSSGDRADKGTRTPCPQGLPLSQAAAPSRVSPVHRAVSTAPASGLLQRERPTGLFRAPFLPPGAEGIRAR